MIKRTLAICALLALYLATGAGAQSDKQGVTYRAPSGATLRLILDSGNVGPEVSLGELTFPPNGDSGEHTHGSIEIFYAGRGAGRMFGDAAEKDAISGTESIVPLFEAGSRRLDPAAQAKAGQ